MFADNYSQYGWSDSPAFHQGPRQRRLTAARVEYMQALCRKIDKAIVGSSNITAVNLADLVRADLEREYRLRLEVFNQQTEEIKQSCPALVARVVNWFRKAPAKRVIPDIKDVYIRKGEIFAVCERCHRRACSLEAGGTLEVIGFSDDKEEALVEYTAPQPESAVPGTSAPSGVQFFIGVRKLAA